MQVIVACKSCHKQYDASNTAPGSSFTCGCGSVVVIPEARVQNDAHAVHCSACGAARKEGERSCSFCHADFTLVEKDLQASCPRCFTRISKHSKFCSNCGSGIHVDMNAGAVTTLSCPACTSAKLSIRILDEQQNSYEECRGCGGIWMGHRLFADLQNSVKDKILPTLAPQTARLDILNAPIAYRKCPNCKLLMGRKNFGNVSGVVIDVCRDHGLWFDFGELTQILEWVKAGGLKAEEVAEKAKQRRRELKANGGSVSIIDPIEDHSHDSSDFVLRLDFLFDLFKGLK